MGTSGTLLADDLADLAADCRLITYNRRGYGASDPSPRSWPAHTEDAAALLERLGAAPATVAGFSGGAIVALDLALSRPELVVGLVLLDPAVHVRRHMTPGLARAYAGARVRRRLRGERAGAERWLRYVAGDAWERMPGERRDALLANASGVFDDMAAGDGGEVDAARLESLDIPVTIVGCELSPPFLRKSVAALEAAIPQARCIALGRSGHAMFFEAREPALDCLRSAVLA